MEVYLDNVATTRIDREVLKTMLSCQDLKMMNASSSHKLGLAAAKAIEKARSIIAQKMCAEPKEVVFTSGGTESNNYALKGIAFANHDRGNHIIISSIEHPSVMESALWLEKQGFEITRLSVDEEGFVDPSDVGKAIKKETILVSVVHANNEIGVIEPIDEIGAMCRRKNVFFHVDACQSFAKTHLDVKKQSLDLVTLSAHKIHGPTGVGALFIREGVKIAPFLHGGGQEDGFRSGTYNTHGIVGFGKAVEIADCKDIERMRKLRDYFIQRIENSIEDVVLNGSREKRICNNINLRFSSINGKELVRKLNERNIFISAGSACSSAKLTPSYTLLAMGISSELTQGAIRISLSKLTTKKELDFTAQNIADIVRNERGLA